MSDLKDIMDEQASDEGLWFMPKTITEDYLQRALRRLHAAVEIYAFGMDTRINRIMLNPGPMIRDENDE